MDSKDFDSRLDPGNTSNSADQLLPGVAGQEANPKPLRLIEVLLKRPYYLDMAKKDSNPYPTLSALLLAHDEESREAEKEANFQKLGVESPEDFGVKNRGLLEQMAEEHGIGQLLGYSFRTAKIEVIGTDKILLLDYDLKPIHTRDVFGVELAEEPDEEEGGEEAEEPAAEPEEQEQE